MSDEHEKQRVRGVIDAWLEASKRDDLDALGRLMAEDVVFLLPGQEPMRGREAFFAKSRSNEKKFRLLEGRPDVREIHVTGNHAICWNHLSLTIGPASGGGRQELAGDVLSVFRKESDGRWVLFRDANLLVPINKS